MFVTTNALVARLPADSALPALNPNQPNHSMAAPSTVSGRLCGGLATPLYPFRRPIISAVASAETPEMICTTVPPAKSSTPMLRNQPPIPQTQWQTGS